MQGDYKKTIPTFGPLTNIPLTETEWNFSMKYCEVCAGMENKSVTQAVTITVRKYQMATPSFLVLECEIHCEKP